MFASLGKKGSLVLMVMSFRPKYIHHSLNFHKVHELNVAKSTAYLVVWVQIRWKDPRLVWDPQEFGNTTKAWFYIEDGMGGGEVSEIWTPDIYLWNQEESMDRSFANSKSLRVDLHSSIDFIGGGGGGGVL